MRGILSVAFIFFTVVAGTAAATGTLETPIASVALENGHDQDCMESVTGLCPVSADFATVGAGWIDATQDNVRIGVVLNDSVVPQLTGVELLPDGAIFIDVSQIMLPNPAFQILMAQEHSFAAPGDQYGVRWDSENLVVWRWSPSTNEPFSGFGHRETTVGYGSGWVTYERIGGFNDLRAPVTSDAELSEPAHFACGPISPGDDAACRYAVDAATVAFNATTPHVVVGLGIDEVGIGPVEDTVAGGIGEREGSGSIGPRASVPSLSSRLDRQGPRATPLDRQPTAQVLRESASPLSRPTQEASPQGTSPPALRKDGPGLPLTIVLAAGGALALLLAALYARITRRADALNSPQRAGIMQHLREHGPTSLQILASALGVHRTTILHHALVLRRLSEIKIIKHGKYAMLALPDHDAAPVPEPRGALMCVLNVLRSADGSMTRQDLHKRLEALPLRTRNHALRELAARGFVAEQEGRLVLTAASG